MGCPKTFFTVEIMKIGTEVNFTEYSRFLLLIIGVVANKTFNFLIWSQQKSLSCHRGSLLVRCILWHHTDKLHRKDRKTYTRSTKSFIRQRTSSCMSSSIKSRRRKRNKHFSSSDVDSVYLHCLGLTLQLHLIFYPSNFKKITSERY